MTFDTRESELDRLTVTDSGGVRWKTRTDTGSGHRYGEEIDVHLPPEIARDAYEMLAAYYDDADQ